jgi:ABC-type cobalt transport system substrate-binding protein
MYGEKPMKKLFLLPLVIALALLSSSLAYADDDDWGDGDDQGYYVQPQINYYYSPPPQVYYPQPQVNNYYYSPQPQVYYAPPPPPPRPQYYGYDQRSHQGLAGGVIGSVLGYELGAGDPIVSGIGAAAGSFLGNGAGMRY